MDGRPFHIHGGREGGDMSWHGGVERLPGRRLVPASPSRFVMPSKKKFHHVVTDFYLAVLKYSFVYDNACIGYKDLDCVLFVLIMYCLRWLNEMLRLIDIWYTYALWIHRLVIQTMSIARTCWLDFGQLTTNISTLLFGEISYVDSVKYWWCVGFALMK